VPRNNKDKGRLPPFVPLFKDTINCLAWKHMSFGARNLYVALKCHVPKGRNVAYLSYRNAAKELGITNWRRIGEWYAELEHYGFIALHRYGALGVDGKGKAPQWRLTEMGDMPSGELPSRDFLRWDGILFEPSPSRNRLGTIPSPSDASVGVPPVVNLVMSTTPVTVNGHPMYATPVTVREGGVADAGDTTVRDAGDRVFATPVTGFCFPSVRNAGDTWDGDEHELATRFLAAPSVRDRSPKD
jgi:hypothetical protein